MQPLEHTLLDLCPQGILFLEEPGELEREMERLWLLLDSEYAEAREEDRPAAPPEQFYLRWDQMVQQGFGRPVVHAEELGLSESRSDSPAFQFPTRPAPSFHGHLDRGLAELKPTAQHRIVPLTGGSVPSAAECRRAPHASAARSRAPSLPSWRRLPVGCR